MIRGPKISFVEHIEPKSGGRKKQNLLKEKHFMIQMRVKENQ